ncbi:hypothetical protein C0J52_20073 [Blattella germanica]|nr:hypothetical protein C0J52_20073 [Blattella germanica]
MRLCDRLDDVTRRESSGLLANLNDAEFLFWLEFFHRIMPHADILFKELQQRNLNPEKAKSYVLEFENVVNNIRNSAVDYISSSYKQNEGNPRKKRKATNKSSDTKDVCDVMIKAGRLWTES